MRDGEDNVRQRIKTEKAALKEKVGEIKRKMKEKEASQQWKESIIVVFKPVIIILLIIALLFGLFFYFSQDRIRNDSINYSLEDDALDGVEEIIAEVEEE